MEEELGTCFSSNSDCASTERTEPLALASTASDVTTCYLKVKKKRETSKKYLIFDRGLRKARKLLHDFTAGSELTLKQHSVSVQ